MNKRVLATILEKGLITYGDRIIVALSGGADSVSLLYVLMSLRDELSIQISAAHVNHCLRGEESDRDEAFVCRLCQENGIELFLEKVDVAGLAKERGESEELCGRQVRYEFFCSLSESMKAKVATAHTMSDAQETMLFNIARGTSLHGLRSIPYKRDFIIRPLLDVTRAEVEQYCRDNQLEFVTDSTNFDENVCERNKIRLSVLPPLKEINSGFDDNFRRLRTKLAEIDDYMCDQASKVLIEAKCEFGVSSETLASLDPALRSYALMIYLKRCGVAAQSLHISLIESILKNGGAVSLPDGMRAVCSGGVLRIIKKSVQPNDIEIKVCDGLSFEYCGKRYTLKKINKLDIVHNSLTRSVISCDKIDGDVCIRNRQSSDCFEPIGRGVNKSLRKLQNEMKIPHELRDMSLLIAKGHDVLWCEHIGVSQKGIISNAENGIYIEIEGDKNDA